MPMFNNSNVQRSIMSTLNMPGPHKGISTQRTNQQVLAKPIHQPSERDQQAIERLRQKVKIKSHAYIQLGEKVLQTVHQTFEQ